MKNVYSLLFLFVSVTVFAQNHNVGIGTTMPDRSALLDMKATDKGVLVPRLNTAQRLAIVNPAIGLLVYDSTLKCFYYFDGTQWNSLCAGTGTAVGPTGATGTTGSTGLQGSPGATGATGDNGLVGS